MLTFYWYPKCSTCKKAKVWLDEHHVKYELVDMIQNPPSEKILASWMEENDMPIRRFFNTSGIKYREQGLKDKVAQFDISGAASLLATDGMLIKRPITTDGKKITLGFKEEEFEKNWL